MKKLIPILLAVSVSFNPNVRIQEFFFEKINFEQKFKERQIQPELETKLIHLGINQEDLDNIMSDERLEYTSEVKRLLSRNPERSWDYEKYRTHLLTSIRIKNGKKFIKENYDLLKEVEEKTSVSLYDITAILGIETSYGQNTGRHIAFNALYSRYLDFPNNQEWMIKEMAHLINLSKKLDLDLFKIKGSYAGCIGFGQFLPSSWMNVYGKWDIKDPFNKRDVFYAIAQYLLNAGYDRENIDKRYNAFFDYNRSHWYVKVIIELSDSF